MVPSGGPHLSTVELRSQWSSFWGEGQHDRPSPRYYTITFSAPAETPDVSREYDGIQNESKLAVSAVPRDRSGPMKQSKFSEEQIVHSIHQAEGGTLVGDLAANSGEGRHLLRMEKKYAHLG